MAVSYSLVASHLSSVFASSVHVTAHSVPTSRRDIPLATALSDVPEDHASHSSLFHSPETGHVLIRVVQGGLAVELVSLSHSVAPIRFVFPAAVVPSPALATFVGQVYLIVVTSVGTLFRINLPLHEGGQHWHEPLPRNWCREWQIRKLGSFEPRLVHVHDPQDIAIALNTGGYIRLQFNNNGSLAPNEQWSETEWKLSNWYSALLPVISSSRDHPGEIVSMASSPLPTDVSDLFTISRDRVLRRWTVAKGCRSEIALTPAKGSDETSAPLLDARPQKLLQVLRITENPGGDLDENKEILSVLVFIPTPTSSTAGGLFHLYSIETYLWKKVVSFDASSNSAHCKLQDFLQSGDKLYVLWEKQGQSMLEMTHMKHFAEPDAKAMVWNQAQVDQYNELTQEAVDELLLQPGSLTDKFLQAVLRPGLFSVITLRAALQDYREHYLSLPGPHPSPLISVYATLSESIAAVVGCTVALTRDPHTGVALHKQYWNALRRDWEGFVARCKEIERSARWPVCLGFVGNSQALVIERERICQCIEQDTPMQQYRKLSSSSELDPVHFLLSTCWMLRSKISTPLLQRIEGETLNILKQEFAFPLADIISEASNKIFSRDDLDEEFEILISGRLETIEEFNSAIHLVLDVIGGLDKAVKREEDEVELIIPPVTLEWIRAMATSYIAETIEVRYELCIALAVLLFFMGEDLKRYDPALLPEVFSVIRGVTMCRYLCRQPAGDLEGTKPSVLEAPTADDVASRLSSMHMSRVGKNPVPTYALVHQLLSETGHPALLPAAAHYFLDQIGLLASESPAHATRSEVLICERLRLLGYYESSRYLLTWLPRTPAVCYVLGRLWMDVGREDEAVLLLQGVAGSFGPDSVLSRDDHDALSSVLPAGGLFLTQCDYYLHVAELFRAARMVSYEVSFTKLALSVWPEGEDLTEVSVSSWAAVIKGYTDLGLYEDAYCALISSPHHDQRHQCVSHLVYKMCEDDALDCLLSMNFRGLVQEVELSLSFKARNADPRSRPNWSQILYTWYTVRGDYRNAALTMYIRSRRLSELLADPTAAVELAEQQAEALSIAMNALGLTEGKDAYIVVSLPGASLPPRKRRKTRSYVPEDRFTSGRRNVEIVKLSNIEQEYAHLVANIELLRRDPTLVRNGELSLTPWVTVSKLTQAGLYDLAMHTARVLSVDMSELFQRLAMQCLQLSATTDSALMEVAASDWLLTDKVSSWPGTPADRGWRYLRQCLERYDSAETDYSNSKAVLETLLPSPPPPWLLQTIVEHHPDYLIRAFLRYGNVEEALEHTLQIMRNSMSAWGRSSSDQASSTWLPYTVIDTVLKTTEENVSPRAQNLRQSLQTEVSNRIICLQKHSEKASH